MSMAIVPFSPSLRQFAVAAALIGATLGGAAFAAPAVAQTTCDPSYPDFCIPPPSEVGDLDCGDIAAGNFTVYQPDPHYLDADYDGIGCEAS